MSRTVQIELVLEVEIQAKFTGQAWETEEIVSIRAVHDRNQYCLGASSLLANYLLDERGDELADLFAQQEP